MQPDSHLQDLPERGFGRLDWAVYPDQPFVYASIVLTIAMGFLLRGRRSALSIGATGLAASVLFFLITNFGIWLVGGGVRYAQDLPGLVECYTMGLPFFRNSLISMAAFSAVLFSPIALATLEEAEAQTKVVAPAT